MGTIVIVGGVAGGATAATRLRRSDEGAEIILIERGEHVSFANCGLPYHIGGIIQERDSLLVATPELLRETFRIDVRTRHEVTAIDPEAHQVMVRDLATGEHYTLAYDQLLLSPGAKPVVPPLPGIDLPGVRTLRSIPDMDAILRHLTDSSVRDAVVVGGGFIGLEMAENLAHRGIKVSLVEMLPQVMAVLDFEMAALVHQELRRNGVRLALGDGLQSIEETEAGRLRVNLSSGRATETDMVILAIGVRPESDLAHAAGLELGPRGHIVVDEQMRTSSPDIFAVGDAVQVTDPITGRPTAVPLAGPANRQARIAASQMAGHPMTYRGTMGTAIAKVFGLTVATTGASSRTLEQAGMAYADTITHSYDHVGYYPGATRQTIKLLYAPEDGRLLGAQVVGVNAVDRTIDVLATALHAGMSVYDLEELELAYAPPYGAAKDPVNIAGYVGANRLRGDAEHLSWRDLADRSGEDLGLLDVRTQVEWDLGHMEGAFHIPLDQLRDRLGELDRDRSWIVYCAIGQRAYTAERVLVQHGYTVVNLSGGYSIYLAATEQQDNWDTPPSGCENGLLIELPQRVAVDEETGLALGSPHPAPPMEQLDACGLQCPGPIMAVYKRMLTLQPGDELQVQATDPGFARDVAAWCEQTGNGLLDLHQERDCITALIAKSDGQRQPDVPEVQTATRAKTLVVFSADLDRALAAFVIANGAASMGQPVTMFFTFWGLNILRRPKPEPARKSLVERMFGWMMPRGPAALKLSKLHMGGLGTAMIKQVMKAKNVDSLDQMMASARDLGVRLIACQMSMDLMGIRAQELVDGVDIGGVATYIAETDKGNATLFI
jgi:NADPH-dependent 2,4-dienoyl-CoA reductase/sulfur reductase-like enzyme/peroxiredoxin family protein/rhodanese-related sulfurtransferase/TusA-related sulfurtransferase